MKHAGEFDMSRLLLSFAITVSVSVSMFSVQVTSQQLSASKKAARMQIVKGPALESATDNSAIIRWTTNTGSSSIEHSVVHYGTDPNDLGRRAESVNRWNSNLPYMIPVSYTHLRAHETVLDLVCRLLLEKK